MSHEIVRPFREAGVDLSLLRGPLRNVNPEIFQMDILHSRIRECVRIWPGERRNKLVVTSIDPAIHQLVLQVREPVRTFEVRMDKVRVRGQGTLPPVLNRGDEIVETADTYWTIRRHTDGALRRFLCGQDETHLFAAQFRDGDTVPEAHASLRPPLVTAAERRWPGETVRQGEWFFIPIDAGELDGLQEFIGGGPRRIQYRVPIGPGGNPHVADQLVHRSEPAGFSRRRFSRGRVWEQIRVYARGAVRHPEHQTIRLDSWRRVVRNLEITSSQVGDNGLFWID